MACKCGAPKAARVLSQGGMGVCLTEMCEAHLKSAREAVAAIIETTGISEYGFPPILRPEKAPQAN